MVKLTSGLVGEVISHVAWRRLVLAVSLLAASVSYLVSVSVRGRDLRSETGTLPVVCGLCRNIYLVVVAEVRFRSEASGGGIFAAWRRGTGVVGGAP